MGFNIFKVFASNQLGEEINWYDYSNARRSLQNFVRFLLSNDLVEKNR